MSRLPIEIRPQSFSHPRMVSTGGEYCRPLGIFKHFISRRPSESKIRQKSEKNGPGKDWQVYAVHYPKCLGWIKQQTSGRPYAPQNSESWINLDIARARKDIFHFACLEAINERKSTRLSLVMRPRAALQADNSSTITNIASHLVVYDDLVQHRLTSNHFFTDVLSTLVAWQQLTSNSLQLHMPHLTFPLSFKNLKIFLCCKVPSILLFLGEVWQLSGQSKFDHVVVYLELVLLFTFASETDST